MKIISVKVGDLVPYKNNPRKNDVAVEKVAESIQRFGFQVPITIDRNNVVVTGHTRLKAAIKLGIPEVPCVVLEDLTPDQIKAFRIVDNKTSEYAEWDFPALALELKDIKMDLSAFELEVPGDTSGLEEDNFDIKLPKTPRAKLGDIYELGRHRLLCGDATKTEDVARLVGETAIDLVVTDPPYNVDYEGGTQLTMMNDKQSDAQFLTFLVMAFNAMRQVMKPGAAYYIWHADSAGNTFRQAAENADLHVRQCLIWNKNSLVLGRQDYQWKHEPCLYGWKAGAAHYFIDDRGFTTVTDEEPINVAKMKVGELRDLVHKLMEATVPVTVINEDKPHRNGEHPTMKPIRLIGRLIANSSKPGWNVLDTFGGSGSTMISAEQLGRRCFMMELDPRYVDVIIDRFETLTGLKAVKISPDVDPQPEPVREEPKPGKKKGTK